MIDVISVFSLPGGLNRFDPVTDEMTGLFVVVMVALARLISG
jgi:hypothetical protein